jgi:hypothetical protein
MKTNLPGDVKTDYMELTYERSDIPQELIDECNKLSDETGEIYFIFDRDMTSKIENHYLTDKQTKRNSTIDIILPDNNKYYIGGEVEFGYLPSRFAYYDTEIRLTDRYTRYKYVKDFLDNLTFEPGLSNLGPEFEQSFVLELEEDSVRYKFLIRIQPNLFVRVMFLGSIQETEKLYDGFFSKSDIYKSIQRKCPNSFRKIIRERKLEDILNKKETN